MIQKRTFSLLTGLFFGIFGLTLSGCDSTSVDDSLNEVGLQFQTTVSSTASAKTAAGVAGQSGDTLRIEGNNGTLLIDDVRFIVEDFEMEKSDNACEDSEGSEDDCEEFEAGPFFVDLPLRDGDILNLDTFPVESGLYEELEFEIDDLDLDEESDDDKQQKQSLADEIRSEFPDWPDEVSMVVTGHFISTENDTTAFTTFAEAEVEVELEFEPPVEIDETTVNQMLKINIDPANWFLRSNGSVYNISEYDYESSGQILEFEVEIEEGFESIEVEGDDDDDDDEEED